MVQSRITDEMINTAAISLVLETKKHFKKLRDNAGLPRLWKTVEKAYFEGLDDFYKGVSKIKVPVLFNAVETIVPKIDKVIFPPDGEYFAVTAKNLSDELEVAEAESATALLKQQLTEIAVRQKLIGVARNKAIYGTTFIKTFWNHIEKKRYIRNESGERIEDFDVVHDSPDFYSPSIWDIWVDPKDENLRGAVIEDIVVEWSDLWKERERNENDETIGVFNTDSIKQLKTSKITRTIDTDKEQSEIIRGLTQHEFGPHEKKILMSEYWGPVPKWMITKKQEDKDSEEIVDNALIVIGSTDNEGKSAVVLRSPEDNPFDHQEKPYERSRYIKIDGRLYGIGAIIMGVPLEAEINTLRNQLVDMRTFMLKNKWLRDKNAGISESQLRDIKNAVIDTDDMNGLEALRPPDFSGSALSQELNIKQDVQDTTGASKLIGGTPSGSSLDRTAAGIATVVQGGLERFELVVTTMEEELLKPLIRKFWMLNQQFLPDGQDVEISGKRIIRVLPSEIQFNKNINFIGLKELGEKEFKVTALNILSQNADKYVELGIDPVPIIFELLKLLGLGRLRNEIDKRPENDLEQSPEGELQLLRRGRKVRIDLNDNHQEYIAVYQQLLNESDISSNVRRNTLEALGQRLKAIQILNQTSEASTNVEEAPGTVR